MSRPSFDPSDKQRGEVKLLAGFGISHEDIAAYLGVDPKTLRKHFTEELKRGVTEANAKIAQRLFKKAMDGDTTALIWWEKTRSGKTDKIVTEHTGKDGGPIQVDVTKLSDDEIERRIAELSGGTRTSKT